MSNSALVLGLLFLGLYAAFWLWYGGRGRPLTAAEVEARLAEIQRRAGKAPGAEDGALLQALRVLAASDDGREFQAPPCAPGFSAGPADFWTATTVNKGHGRTETRTLTSSSSLQGFLDWPGAAQVFQLERRIQEHRTAVIRREVVYGVTSLPAAEAGPSRLLHLVRLHWEIENDLHYRRDVTFKEDACRLRQPVAQRILATVNNLILGILLNRDVTNVPQARRHFAAQPAEALAIIFGSP